jgi:carboxyl-terminal processing protease
MLYSCFARMDKGVIVYICDSKGVRDIYEADGAETIAASEPLVVLVCPSCIA